jgi:hypothetical protein
MWVSGGGEGEKERIMEVSMKKKDVLNLAKT